MWMGRGNEHVYTAYMCTYRKNTILAPRACCAEEVGTNGMMTNVCRVFNDKARAARAYARF